MTESYSLSKLLLPELEAEFTSTGKTIEHLPDGHGEFKPHEKSTPLAHLAEHMVGLVDIILVTLKESHYDFGATPPNRLTYESRPQLLGEFHERTDKAITALKATTDEMFHQTWKLGYHGKQIFSGPRFLAYRMMGVNHMIHHRAQIGVYLRLLNLPVPSTFGPTADEPFKL
jgi:uncharacterized damage-inducible protein DinB